MKEVSAALLLNPKKLINLSKLFLGLFIFLLPVQLGRHFWPDWTYVLGLKIDYLSPTVYLTDVFVLAILAFWGIQDLRISKLRILNFKLVVVFGFLLANAFLAQNQAVAFYKFFKIIELTLLGLYFAHQKIRLEQISLPLSLAVIYSSLIAFFQFLKQQALGGFFYWLGERSFNISTPGIAKATFRGQLWLRPYATFPHPNVLGGFVLVALILILAVKPVKKIEKILRWPVLALGVISLIFSFSRVVWAGGILAVLLRFWLGLFSKKKKFLALFGAVGLGESLFQRVELNKIAWQMIKNHPLFGIGLNNFISQLPEFLSQIGFTYLFQPVHNIFLLTAAETGLVGLTIFVGFLLLTFKKLLVDQNQPLIIALSVILFTGLFDHYWLTLQQAQLLLTLVLGLSWAKPKIVLK